MSEALEKKDLLCIAYKQAKNKFREYRGFRISPLKLLIEYTFSGFEVNIEHNYKERRFDIFLCKKNKDTSEEIDLKEVEKFRKFYGRGFHLIIYEETE